MPEFAPKKNQFYCLKKFKNAGPHLILFLQQRAFFFVMFSLFLYVVFAFIIDFFSILVPLVFAILFWSKTLLFIFIFSVLGLREEREITDK